jgi:hypothetical protein
MPAPADSLRALAAELKTEESVIAAHARDADPLSEPALGLLVATGPRAADAPGEYALLFESVREGYLLHYAASRVLADVDPDLALLAGDHLYALGLCRLAVLGDLEAVRELADLISLSAQVNGERERGSARATAECKALWLASAVAVGFGGSASHEHGKAELRAGGADAGAALWAAAREAAAASGAAEPLRVAADSIDFRPDPRL